MAEISDERVLLLERTLQKNKEVIEENQKLETGKEERGKLSECTIHTALIFIPALLGKAAWPDFHNNIYFL